LAEGRTQAVLNETSLCSRISAFSAQKVKKDAFCKKMFSCEKKFYAKYFRLFARKLIGGGMAV